MHYHIGENLPGYLPEEEPQCVGPAGPEIFLSLLWELVDQWNEACVDADSTYGHCGFTETCGHCKAARSAHGYIAEYYHGDVVKDLSRQGEYSATITHPDGVVRVLWIAKQDGGLCED